ncbi:hypothetical protein [Candidatus Mycoplasma mahonii]|uniref:hypothetical protein n=1 Tax=Candidatus Mycoplasma mahonii TaxID=3004105 RepID=UPI0026EE0542|nr:hypothetical protein [Candidatus Mycoplasma mahonii]WKX02593.1 hypothetical protein O3I44_00745 [Candidatus Mycoplasma mahonii]
MVNDKKIVISELTKNRQLIICHSHYTATGRTRLYHSFSTNNEFDNKTNAIANRALTHHDILHFKEVKYDVYDFGGIGNVNGDNTKYEGIIWFKKQFGGSEKILWKGTTLNGDRGKAVYDKYWK